ncbi:hypothetical protein, partial [Nocardia mangyaensis]|uniref:hypothetical protein n=1 Tax=Nocardia mangyaensis TaxID=2213200 RepID=UPI002674A703
MESDVMETPHEETERIVEIIQTINYILHKRGEYVGIYDVSYTDIVIPVEEEHTTLKSLFYELNSIFERFVIEN